MAVFFGRDKYEFGELAEYDWERRLEGANLLRRQGQANLSSELTPSGRASAAETLHAAGAVRAGARTGRIHIFGYDQDALDARAWRSMPGA